MRNFLSLLRSVLVTALFVTSTSFLTYGQQAPEPQSCQTAETPERLREHYWQLTRFRWLSAAFAGDERVIQDDLQHGRAPSIDRDMWVHGLQIQHNELVVVRSILLEANAKAKGLEAESPFRRRRESDFHASLCFYNAKQDQIFDDAIFQIQQQLGEKSFTNFDQELRRFVHDQNSPPASSTKSRSTQPSLVGDRSEVQS